MMSTRATTGGARPVSRAHGHGWTTARVAATLSIVAGVLADECAEGLRAYFRTHREA